MRLLRHVDAGEGVHVGGFGVAWREGCFQLHVVAGHVWRGVARPGGRAPVDGVEDARRVEGGSTPLVVLLFTAVGAAFSVVGAAGYSLVTASSAGTWLVFLHPFGICKWVSRELPGSR